jgi:Tol biopolymer transport system component
VVEGGIYTVPLAFDVAGNLVGAQQPATLAVELSLNGSMWPSVRSYCWAPTGDMIAYEDTTALYVADLLDGTHTLIVNQVSHTPQWSPDGRKIAFTNSNVGISIVKPNGTGLKEIVKRRPGWTFDRVFWSPDGSDIVVYGFYVSGSYYNADIFRATSAGKFLTNLTNSASAVEHTMGWR